MGIAVRSEATRRLEMENFRRMLLSCSSIQRKKDGGNELWKARGEKDDVVDRMVCVTSGVSYLGAAIVKQLLLRGYYVRLVLDNQAEDAEKLTEMEAVMRGSDNNNILEAMTANLTDAENLSEVINGCHAVFHTAAFIDPSGVSGYSKSMAELEAKVTDNVMRACAMSPSVRNCVMTSSLLACVWQSEYSSDVIDHNSWSDESLCINNKLWYALGKLRAEKVAWKIAREEHLRLATICPALVTGPSFYASNPTPTIAYLKGAKEMYAKGLLAAVDVNRLAEAHIRVLEGMNKKVYGRYICFDRIIGSEDEVEKLAGETRMDLLSMISANASRNCPTRFKFSNAKISQLMSRMPRCINEC